MSGTYLTPDAIDDLVQTTLSLFKKKKWTDISLEYQNFASGNFISSFGVEERGGTQLSFRAQVRNAGNAKNAGLYSKVNKNVEDVMETGTVPWTKQICSFYYDIDEEAFQSDPETIIDELKIKEHSAMNDMAVLQENNFWSSPAGTSDKAPFGVPYWFQRSATAGFNGGNPAAFSAGCAGLSSVEYEHWRNYTDQYTTVNRTDLVVKIKLALASTNFHAVHNHPTLGFSKPDRCIYTTLRVTEPLERLAEDRNDRLGSDVAKFIDAVTVGGVPIKWVAYLQNNDTTDPLYGIDRSKFRPFVLKGKNMRRHKPIVAPSQPTVREVHYDHWMNYACYDRRSCFVLYK